MIELRVLGTPELVDDQGRSVTEVLRQPKRLALLVHLALASHRGFCRRDLLLALLWPESSQERARGALRQATYHLRKALGGDVLVTRGDGDLGLAPGRVTCDALELRRLLDAGRAPEAVRLYQGDLLPGLYVPEAEAFERWLDEQREDLRSAAGRAALALARAAGPAEEAVRWARRASEILPHEEEPVRLLMAALDAGGDPGAALRVFREHARDLATELEDEPAAATRALAEEIRRRWKEVPPAIPPEPVRVEVGAAGVGEAASPASPVRESPLPGVPRRRPGASVLALGAVVLLTAWLGGRWGAELGSARVAVAGVDDSAAVAVRSNLAEVTTRSVVAYRFYQEGLRAYYGGDRRGAGRMFVAALGEDSTFAMAAYYASLAGVDGHRSLLRQAVRLGGAATDRERLVIQAAWTAANDDPARMPVADTLAIRYPDEPDGHLWQGRAAVADGRFLDAVPPLGRVVRMDSLGLAGIHPRCRACEALAELATAYVYADSLAAAERTAREWTRAQPRSSEPWVQLFFVQEAAGDLEGAMASLDSVAAREPGHWALGMRGGVFLRRGEFEAADRFLLERMANGDRAGVENGLWGLTLSLRHQGRFAEALDLARRYRWLGAAPGTPPQATLHRSLLLLSVLQDMGRHREAIALADSVASLPLTGESGSRDARATAWALTQSARSAAALGDTVRLRVLADSVRTVGALSGYARDRRLHHHVRGLLLQRRGDFDGAVAEFRRALYSLRGGYVRTNLELARSLVATGDPAAAVPVLEAAVNGPIGADGMWSTRTELRRALATAHRARGDDGSAHRELAWVRAALARADAGPD